MIFGWSQNVFFIFWRYNSFEIREDFQWTKRKVDINWTMDVYCDSVTALLYVALSFRLVYACIKVNELATSICFLTLSFSLLRLTANEFNSKKYCIIKTIVIRPSGIPSWINQPRWITTSRYVNVYEPLNIYTIGVIKIARYCNFLQPMWWRFYCKSQSF